MTHITYQQHRQRRGSLRAMAKALGVNKATIIRREAGKLPINREAELALLSLPEKEK
jgi:DNA-binding XRE family transcriptional regulator